MIKQFVHITRFLMLVCLLVAQSAMVSGHSSSSTHLPQDTHQTNDSEEEAPTLQEWFVTSLAPSHQFHFDEVSFDWPVLSWGFLPIIFRPTAAPQGNYSRVVFLKIFERLIAINAP